MSWSSKIRPATQLPTLDEALALLPKTGKTPKRVLVLSDIHANWHALTAVLRHAQAQDCNATWFLGDIVGYGSRPVECVSFLRQGLSLGGRWLAGNHDYTVAGTMHSTLRDYKSSGDAATSREKHVEILQQPDNKLEWDWLRAEVVETRAKMRTRRYRQATAHFVHGDPVEEVGSYVYPDDRLNISEHLRNAHAKQSDTDKPVWIFSGHTHCVCVAHLPKTEKFTRLRLIQYGIPQDIGQPGGYWVNPGAVGQPRDGDARAAYAVLDLAQRTLTHHRVKYDTLAVQVELQSHRYSDSLVVTIGNGLRNRVTSEHFENVYRRLPDGSGVEPV